MNYAIIFFLAFIKIYKSKRITYIVYSHFYNIADLWRCIIIQPKILLPAHR